ncbi:hypothetical protein [Thermomonospora umbrina]|uniref:hypothetical protein n=1 Tax=Thermomonospora umbrina TaxID=111806 RepID=UPI000E26A7A9|nr:hypothetical protein [Thermomonospora umbrina]
MSDRSNGLIDAQPGGVAIVFTGVHTGEVDVTLDVRDRPPPSADTDTWDDVVEVSLHAPEGQVRVSSVGAETEDEHLLPVATPAGPGDYRIRVHARGRDGDPAAEATEFDFGDEDDDYDGALEDDGTTEEYLVMVWPAPTAPTTVHKQTDAYGAALREHARKP